MYLCSYFVLCLANSYFTFIDSNKSRVSPNILQVSSTLNAVGAAPHFLKCPNVSIIPMPLPAFTVLCQSDTSFELVNIAQAIRSWRALYYVMFA